LYRLLQACDRPRGVAGDVGEQRADLGEAEAEAGAAQQADQPPGET
jgi:hypothetical protein